MTSRIAARAARIASAVAAIGLTGALFLAAPAAAQYSGPSGVAPTTVSSLLKNGKDNQRVVLRGRLTKKLTDDKYEFTDKTGSIRVEIDDDRFPPEPIDDKTLVEIQGEFEKEFLETPEIDVDHLRRVSGT